jgi:chondroitin 4-sulfotransferase 11
MLLDDLGLIFVHITRTGGTSIETALAGQDWWQISPHTKHLSARQIRIQAGEEKWAKYFKFSLVRNPWDRVVSMFATGWWMSDDRQPDAEAAFEFFIQNLAPHPHEMYSSLMYSDIINENLDMTIRYEALQQGFDMVCEAINKPTMLLGRAEARERLHYSTYYTDTTRRLVGKLFKKDIEDYQYIFEEKIGFSGTELTSLCEAAIKRRQPPPAPPVREASDRLLWLGPKLSVVATRLLRRARSGLFADPERQEAPNFRQWVFERGLRDDSHHLCVPKTQTRT